MKRQLYIIVAAFIALLLVPSKSTAQWHMIDLVDEWGDVTGERAAASTWVKPTRPNPMPFPYHNLKARIMVDCDFWFIESSENLNLIDGDTRNTKLPIFSVPIRVDGKNDGRWKMALSQDARTLLPRSQAWAIRRFKEGSSFAIALKWYQLGSVVLKWSLSGSSKMIQNSCE